MTVKRSGNKYWYEKHENLCLRWLSATTEIEKQRVYNALLPACNYMIENIMQRYYHVPNSMQGDVKTECISHIFINLHKYDSSRQKAYTFISALIKYYLYDIMVRIPNINKNKITENVDEFDFDNQDKCIEYYQVDYDTNEIIAALDLKIIEFKSSVKRNVDGYRISKIIEYIEACKEYIIKYDNINPNFMVEFCFHRIESINNKANSQYFFYQIFGIHATVFSDDAFAKEDKYNILDDDVPNNLNYINKYHKRLKSKNFKSNYSFF